MSVMSKKQLMARLIAERTSEEKLKRKPGRPRIDPLRLQPKKRARPKPKNPHPMAILADTVCEAEWDGGRCSVLDLLRAYNLRAHRRGGKTLTERKMRSRLANLGAEVAPRPEWVDGKLKTMVTMTGHFRRRMQAEREMAA